MRDLPPGLPLARQDGVVSRTQLLEQGCTEPDLRRWLRRRELVGVHRGVYVTHTGPLAWAQRAWAAVLWASPGAGLYGVSALRAHGHPVGPADQPERWSPVHVAVDRDRTLAAPAGVELHRVTDLAARTQGHLSPPRMRYDDALLDVAAAGTPLGAVALLTAGVSARRTTAERVLACAGGRHRLRQRAWLEAVLTDIAAGTCSALEHGYLTRVERPHGLPRGERQAADRSLGGVVYRDVRYGRLLVELDGRAWHDDVRQRDRDLARDLRAAVDGHTTARLSWGLVFGEACATAAAIGALLRARGWRGQTRDCPRCDPRSQAA